MSGPGARPGRRTRAFVEWTLRYGRWIWLAAIVLAVPATWRTAQLYLHLKSDLEELLPRHAPSVEALDELRRRMPGLQYLGILVDTGDAAHLPAGEHFIDDLAERVRSYPPSAVRAVRTGSAEEHAFLEKHATLYVDVQDLEAIRARIEARRDWEVSHETGAALDDEATPPSLDIGDIEKKYEGKLPTRGSAEGDRYSSKELHLTMLLVEVGGFSSGTAEGKALLARVKSDVAALGGTAAYAPGMRVGFSGDVAISVEELDALISDLAVSSVLVVCAVVAVIILYYRWTRSVVVLVPPLLFAAVYAFGLASLPPFDVTALNSNTAFLGAIIVGNGVNFGIVLLARYMEERRKGAVVNEALVVAVASARSGTLSAAVGAGVAYASLVSTQFRGFRQFGIIGGMGMVFSWAIAFILMPPLIGWLDRGGAAAVLRRPAPHRILSGVASFVVRFPGAIVLLGLVLTLGAAAKVATFSGEELESDVSKLRRRDTWTSGEGYWGRKMDSLLGQYLTPMVLLTDSREQARDLAARLREEATHPPLAERVSQIRTLDDVLPSHQAEKIAEASAIRADLTPKIRSLLSPEKRADLDRLLGDEDTQPITLAQLPRTFTTALIEDDGSAGRTVLVFPRPSKALWKGEPLSSFVRALRDASATVTPRPARVAGSLPLSADILDSIRRDGPIASAIAFLGVSVVVILMVRQRSLALCVLGALSVGVLGLIALTMILGVKVNFANFIAFPITFGIGVDYAVNVVTRYAQDAKHDVVGTIRETGSAVALCSLTTIIGYSSLLVAENRALFLFGVVAVLGEITCLTTALTLLPAVLKLLDSRRAARTASATPAE